MSDEEPNEEGIRSRKRRETLHRIAEVGLRLFDGNGYDQTTLEAIATASGISPRTFFYYFKTKDEILQYWQGAGFLDALRPALLEQSTSQAPLDAVKACLLRLTAFYEDERSIIVDRILQSSEALSLRKQAMFVAMEADVYTALLALWPEPERRSALRMVAMVAIGAMRLAMEAWREGQGAKPLSHHLQESFAVLQDQVRLG